LTYEQREWERAAADVGGITPFEAKSLYAVGLVRHLLEASGRCLAAPSMDLPGFVLAAEAAEAVGRCLLGDRQQDRGSGNRLKVGLLAAMQPATAITTPHGVYDVDTCKALRNFTTHGGTTPTARDILDRDLINQIVRGLATALDRCWGDLAGRSGIRQRFEKALLRPLWTSGKVVFVADMKTHVVQGGLPGQGLMYEHAWR
jgi:hypothetical protein